MPPMLRIYFGISFCPEKRGRDQGLILTRKHVFMKINLHLPSLFALVLFIIGCKEIKVLTARNHEPKLESAQSVRSFVKAKNIDGFPVLRYDSSFPDSMPPFLFDFGLFNRNGNYLSLDESNISCREDDYNYLVLKNILQHGDSMLRQEFIKTTYLSLPHDSLNLINQLNDSKIIKAEWDSLFILYGETHIIKMDLGQYADHLIDLNGEKVDMKLLYTHYLILQEFSIAGESGLWAMRIKDLIRDIRKLNKEFGNQIQLVLINTDIQYSFE
jgi:hypothetical protein